jgi:hypothetical protein
MLQLPPNSPLRAETGDPAPPRTGTLEYVDSLTVDVMSGNVPLEIRVGKSAGHIEQHVVKHHAGACPDRANGAQLAGDAKRIIPVGVEGTGGDAGR